MSELHLGFGLEAHLAAFHLHRVLDGVAAEVLADLVGLLLDEGLEGIRSEERRCRERV